MRQLLLLSWLLISQTLFAQDDSATTKKHDPEFPKGFIMHARLHQGMLSNFHGNDLYLGGLQLVPQWTIVEHKLRGGVVLGTFYTASRLQGLAGPTLSYKLSTIHAGVAGSLANIHVSFDHLWGTDRQALAGAGIHLDLGNLLVIGLHGYRDYKQSNWWFQQSFAIRLSKVKKVKEPFNE